MTLSITGVGDDARCILFSFLDMLALQISFHTLSLSLLAEGKGGKGGGGFICR